MERSYAVAGYTEEKLDEIRHSMGLDKPLPVQYFDWGKGVVQLEFGNSLVTGNPVYDTVSTALSVTGATVLLSGLIKCLEFCSLDAYATSLGAILLVDC